MLDGVRERDYDALLELSDPEVQWHSFFAAVGEGGVYRGHEAMRQYMDDLDEAFESAGAEVDDGLAIGDIVVLVGRLHYRGRDSGVESATPAGWLFHFRRRKLVLFRAFREPEKVLAGIGQRT